MAHAVGFSRCQKCFSKLATLAHVLSLCSRNPLPAHRRHNSILTLLLCELIGSKANSESEQTRLFELNAGNPRLEVGPSYIVSIDSELEGHETGWGQRPDVVVREVHKMCAQIIDVTVVYEAQADCLMRRGTT